VGSSDGRDGSVVIHQDVELFAALLNTGEQVTHALAAGRKSWLQVLRGAVVMKGRDLDAGDGAALENEPELTVTAKVDGTEVLVLDLP
jgi:redox-sensitive bicupin YhaK (pirin superfamily)